MIEDMEGLELCGLSHKEAERFLKVLAHEKSVAETVIQLDAALQADCNALGLLRNEVEEEIRSSGKCCNFGGVT